MAKKSRKQNSKVLAIDLGGTKVLVAAVDSKGVIHDLIREPVDFSMGYKGLIRQIVRIALPIVKNHKLKHGTIASAGPLDPVKGQLLNPTNYKSADSLFWGVVSIARDLTRGLKIPVQLENDAAAAALAEAWIGESRKTKNSVVLTLGTGLGLGIIANGHLVRAGQNLHTEGGHIIINWAEKEWQCGCGNYGCAEAYLSGANFTKNLGRIWGQPTLKGHDLVEAARKGDQQSIDAFVGYGQKLASFICSACMVFAPEVIVISGGFSHSADLFMPDAQRHLAHLMRMHRDGIDMLPTIKISRFRDEAGLLGAAYVAHSRLGLK